MLVWRGITLTLLVISVSSKSNHRNVRQLDHGPALAMFCGKATQHRDTAIGRWVSGSKDCLEGKQEWLDYCKEVYPTLNITDAVEDDEPVHVPTWCKAGTAPPCGGHGHKVKPVKCVERDYKTETSGRKEECTEEQIGGDCSPIQFWKETAAQFCVIAGSTMSDPKAVNPCAKATLWGSVKFRCCHAPDVRKPKPNKGKTLHPTTDEKKPMLSVNPICNQPKVVGLCRALLPAWHYNQDVGECQFFHYGGCGGNKNNFDSSEECVAACQPEKVATTPEPENSFCALPSMTGMCRALFYRYFYDPLDGTCKEFTYGGCGGNKNNFPLKEDCEAKCKGFKQQRIVVVTDVTTRAPKPKLCMLAPQAGLCRASISSYYYDYDAGECKTFSYGGCGGNANRFSTLEDCDRHCSGNIDANGVLSSHVLLPMEDEFQEGVDNDKEGIFDDEDEKELESVLDYNVDSKYDINGDSLDFDTYPRADHVFNAKSASFSSNIFFWVGVAVVVLIITAAVVFLVVRRKWNRPPMTIRVEQPEAVEEKELSPEEKQLQDLQQNGYENPTYKLLEHHNA